MGKSVLKQVSFELCFDDPTQTEASKQFIRGDREQLEALCTAVTNYIQQYLHKSPENFWVNACDNRNSVFGVPQDSQPTQTEQIPLENNTFTSLNNQIPSGNIYLKSSNNLTHNLYLGSLASQASAPVINLSLLQLFDLANALDEYSTDVIALPNLYQQKSVVNFPKWAPVAAVLAIAAGLTPFTLQFARNQQQTETAKKSPADIGEQVSLQPTPSINLSVSPNPSLSPSDSLILPGISSINPQSPNPTAPATQQLPNSTSSVQVPGTPQPGFPTANLPPQGQLVIPPPGNIAQTGNQPNQKTATASAPSSVAIKPNSNKTKITSSKKVNTGLNTGLNTSASKPLDTSIFDSSRATAFNQPLVPPNPAQLEAGINSTSKSPISPAKNGSNSVVSRLRQNRNQSPQTTATNTLFDTSQIAEARTYLKKRWQPPNTLTNALEYSLVVGADGKIERIEPLNKAARDHVDRSGIPLIGEAFVSPNQNGKPIRIRTVLDPSGSVQTFSENE
jgi:hypothetical protein